MVFDSEKQSKDLDKSTFDIVRLGEFRTYRCGALISYLGVWFLILLKVAILASDTYTCINILVYKRWSTEDYQVYEFKVAKWIFTGCISFRFALLLWQLSWAIYVYRRRNIALAYLNFYARLMYGVRYRYQCVFHEIESGKDNLPWASFFVYDQLDDALEVLVADTPRTVINVMTLKNYAVGNSNSNILENIRDIAVNNMKLAIILSIMLCSVVISLFFFFKFCFAMLCYIPVKVSTSKKGFKSIKAFCYFHVNERVRALVSRHHKSKAQLLLDGILDIQEINANPLLHSSSDLDLPGRGGDFTHPAFMRLSSFDRAAANHVNADDDADYSRPPRAHTASSLRNHSFGSESTRLPFGEPSKITRKTTSDTLMTELTFNTFSDARGFNASGDLSYQGYSPSERPNPLELSLLFNSKSNSYSNRKKPEPLLEETDSLHSQDGMLDEKQQVAVSTSSVAQEELEMMDRQDYFEPPPESPLLVDDRSDSPFSDHSAAPYPVRGVSKYFDRRED